MRYDTTCKITKDVMIDDTSVMKIENPYDEELKELVGNGYTNNRAGKRKRLKELKKKSKW